MINEDNVVIIGLNTPLLRVEPGEKERSLQSVFTPAPDWVQPANEVDISVRRDEEAVSFSGPTEDPSSSSRQRGGEKSDKDERRVGNGEGGTPRPPTTSRVFRIVKPDRSVITAGNQNILLHINGEDPPILTG